MEFSTLVPRSPAVRHIVNCYYYIRSEDGGLLSRPARVIPDGFADILLDLDDSCTIYANDETPRAEIRGAVVGPKTRPVFTTRPPGGFRVFGLRLHPWGIHAMTGIPAHLLRDAVLPIEDVLGSQIRRVVSEVAEQCTIEDMAACFDRFISGSPPSLSQESRGIVSLAADRILLHGGTVDISSLADRLGLSHRHIDRLFRQFIGISPKTYSRIARVNALLTQPDTSYGSIGEADFYDQSHLIREFRAITGTTPNRLWKYDDSMSGRFR